MLVVPPFPPSNLSILPDNYLRTEGLRQLFLGILGQKDFCQLTRSCHDRCGQWSISATSPGNCLSWKTLPFFYFFGNSRFNFSSFMSGRFIFPTSFSHEMFCCVSGSFKYKYHYREGPTRFCAILLSQRTLEVPESILDIYRHYHI